MKNIKVVFILSLILLYKSEEYIEEILIEKIKAYHRKEYEFLCIKFIAEEEGKYVIIFPRKANVKEIKGEINHNIKFEQNLEYNSRIYIQDFKKGDYVKILYPVFRVWESEDVNIRIGKMDSYTIINDNFQFINTKEFTDCNKPIYFLLANNNPYPLSNDGFFIRLVHSGEFLASYKKNNYTDEKELLTDNYENININTYNEYIYDVNIIKLQCKKPGILTFFSSFDKYFTMNLGIKLSRFSDICQSYSIDFSPPSFMEKNIYIQMFNLFGCTKIDLNDFGGGNNYEETCGNFISSYNLGEPTSIWTYRINAKTDKPNSIIFSIINNGEIENENIILNENEEIFIGNNNRILIPLNNRNDKKYIKIMCSTNRFNWAYEFSKTNDHNYLGNPHTSREIEVKNNYTYIYNPYAFEMKTNYYWFIIITHNNKNLNLSYSYVNNEEEKNKNYIMEKNRLYFWIFLIILIILFVCFAFKRYIIKGKLSKKLNYLENQREMDKIEQFLN